MRRHTARSVLQWLREGKVSLINTVSRDRNRNALLLTKKTKDFRLTTSRADGYMKLCVYVLSLII